MADEPTTTPGVPRPAPGAGPLASGQVFAGHEVMHEAGRGGMGVVYAAKHVRLGVVRALKVLDADPAGEPIFRARFERESRLAAGLEHPNIVPVYEAGESDGLLYLSMRYVDGPDLSEVVAARGLLDPDEVVAIVTQLAAALDAAHADGLVHRDVKPANIFLEGDIASGRVFLGDFGISRLAAAAQELTGTGEMLGTVSYVAPEQLAGEVVDARADVYSLACVAYEVLTGSAPFVRDTQLATMFAHANAPRPKPSAARPELPKGVDNVFARALAVDPASRHRTASEFAAELSRSLAGGSVSGATDSQPGGRRRPGLWVAGGVMALAVVAAALVATGVLDSGGESNGAAGGERSALPAPTARVAGTVEVARDPVAVTVGELNVWTASAKGHAISAIVPAGSDLARPPTQIDGTPVALAVAFGSVWAVDRDADALIRLDPAEGTVPTRIPVGDRPADVAASSNKLWVTNEGDGTVSRIDPVTNQADDTVAVGDEPTAVTVGEGGIWIANSGDGTLTEIDPVTSDPRGDPVRVGGSPQSLAAGEAGVWVVDKTEGVLRVSPGSRQVSGPVFAGEGATAVATGYGYAWVAFENGTVRRIEPTQLRPAGEPIRVGESPVDIATGKAFVWTANSADSTVTRIQPVSPE